MDKNPRATTEDWLIANALQPPKDEAKRFEQTWEKYHSMWLCYKIKEVPDWIRYEVRGVTLIEVDGRVAMQNLIWRRDEAGGPWQSQARGSMTFMDEADVLQFPWIRGLLNYRKELEIPIRLWPRFT
jgi:hypothetical protein